MDPWRFARSLVTVGRSGRGHLDPKLYEPVEIFFKGLEVPPQRFDVLGDFACFRLCAPICRRRHGRLPFHKTTDNVRRQRKAGLTALHLGHCHRRLDCQAHDAGPAFFFVR
jgi:hypothetical protein